MFLKNSLLTLHGSRNVHMHMQLTIMDNILLLRYLKCINISALNSKWDTKLKVCMCPEGSVKNKCLTVKKGLKP